MTDGATGTVGVVALGLAVLWAGCVAWLLWRATRQMRLYKVIDPEESSDAGRRAEPNDTVTVIVPVRDEERVIARCLTGLIEQDYPADRMIIIIADDNSADRTAEIVGEIVGGATNVRLVTVGGLPSGWAGKPHACWRAAVSGDAAWLCFIDADTCPEPALLRRAIGVASARHLDMLSLEPFQELGTFWERLIIPAGLFAIACARDIRRADDPASPESSVNGQFLLIRRAAYFAVGGHAAVRGEICEDSALARRVKGAGFRVGLFGAEHLIRTRMYGDLASLWQGLSKNVTEVFGGVVPTAAVAAAGLLVGWTTLALPAWTGFAARPGASEIGLLALILVALGSLAVLATQIAGARYFRIPWWYGLLFPLGFTAAALLAFNGVVARARGRVAWKGRIYSVQNAPGRKP